MTHHHPDWDDASVPPPRSKRPPPPRPPTPAEHCREIEERTGRCGRPIHTDDGLCAIHDHRRRSTGDHWDEAVRFLRSLSMPLGLLINIGAVQYSVHWDAIEAGYDDGVCREGWGQFVFTAPDRWWGLPWRNIAPDEIGVRLLGFTMDQARTLRGMGRTGYLSEATCCLGFIVDIDSSQRRGSVGRPYIRTIAHALDLAASVLPPTMAFDSGGGVPCLYRLDPPVEVSSFGDKRLASIGRRFRRAFAEAVEGAGYIFDSPQPATAWIRLPGATTDYGAHLVTTLVSDGPTYSIAEIAEFASAWPDRTSDGFYRPDMTQWNGRSIPAPGQPQGRHWSVFTPRPDPFRRSPDPFTKRKP